MYKFSLEFPLDLSRAWEYLIRYLSWRIIITYFVSLTIIDLLVHYWLYCSCFISFPLFHTLLFMFHFSSFSPQSISFISSTISFIFSLFGCTHNITLSFNLTVNFTFQSIKSLEINNLRVSLDKTLTLDRWSLGHS